MISLFSSTFPVEMTRCTINYRISWLWWFTVRANGKLLWFVSAEQECQNQWSALLGTTVPESGSFSEWGCFLAQGYYILFFLLSRERHSEIWILLSIQVPLSQDIPCRPENRLRHLISISNPPRLEIAPSKTFTFSQQPPCRGKNEGSWILHFCRTCKTARQGRRLKMTCLCCNSGYPAGPCGRWEVEMNEERERNR